MWFKTIRKIGRTNKIIRVLLKYGFDEAVDKLGGLHGRAIFKKIKRIKSEMTTWEKIRHAMEELGPGFIKLGQILSLRPDLIPRSLVLELEKLQDEVTPAPFHEIKLVIEKGLGKSISEIFSFFDDKPQASASLSQVHKAILAEENQEVAVKVQRPGIRRIIETDLSLLENFAHYLHENLETVQVFNLPKLVAEFKRTLLKELRFSLEIRAGVLPTGD